MDLLDSLEFLNSLEFQDMVWFGIDWYGFVWFHMVLFGMVLFSLWFGLVWYGMVCLGLVWFGMVWFGREGMFENVLEDSNKFHGGWVVYLQL